MGETGHFSLPIAAKVKGARDGPRPLQVLAHDVLQTLRQRSFGSPKGGDPQDGRRFLVALPGESPQRLGLF